MAKTWTLFLSFLLISLVSGLQGQPIIHAVTPLDTVVNKYRKFELSVDLTATYNNPYNYDEISVSGQFTAPDGRSFRVDGFFMMDYTLQPNGTLIPGQEFFRLRFSPDMPGMWTYQIQVADIQGTVNSAIQHFQCNPATQLNNKGFVRTRTGNYLRFDDGDAYIPIGENICWQQNNAYMDYKNWLEKMAQNGGNFFRLWHAHWGLGIEWKNNWRGFQGLQQYQQDNARYQDWLFEFCAEKGIYVMLCLQHHGPVSTQVNANWNDSPYNIQNGGPCANTWDFFTHPGAIQYTKNRYRYILARWGYSKNILAWELFNEVDWTDNYKQHQVEVMEWHVEMAEYLKNTDPYDHLVSTSFAHEQFDPITWAIPDMDFTQTHFYVNTPNIELVLAQGNKKYLTQYDKPTLNGEFGIGLSNTLSAVDPKGIHIHNGMWGSLFAGGMGTAMSWWWDIYIDPMDMYYVFDPISMVADRVPFIQEDMQPVKSVVQGAPGDLTLVPTQDWGNIGEDSITLGAGGIIYPENPELSIYLYGAISNTQYRSPPVFIMNYPRSGTFTVKTAATSGFSPRITIYLDGNRVLNESAQTNATYTIAVPAGPHSIQVDNRGADWITIASYTFSELGSSVDSYVLRSADQKTAAGWVLSNQYNHDVVQHTGAPPAIQGAEVLVDGFVDGHYFAKWYDCLTGALISSQPFAVAGGKLKLAVPELLWDLAFVVDDIPGSAASVDQIESLPFSVFPIRLVLGSLCISSRRR